MNRYTVAEWISIATVIAMMLLVLSCTLELASATSYVQIDADSDGGSFNFTGSGPGMNARISIDGFDIANVDLTNGWGDLANIFYQNVGSGNISLNAGRGYPYDKMMYYRWETMHFRGDGSWTVPGGGGRLANLTNSPNVTGSIDYPVADHKATFIFDGRHRAADVDVVVHNGHNLENATVTMYFTNPVVKWTDEYGVARFKLGTGKYHMTVEADGFEPMLVDNLFFEAKNMYKLIVNMTNCTCSAGTPVCGPAVSDLLMYYKEKGPESNPISPQGFVNYFADKLKTCRGRSSPEADGTLERFATRYGVYPNPPLNVVLYSCSMEKYNCSAPDICLWNIDFTVKNYQQYPCNYTVELHAGNTTKVMRTGSVGKTGSSTQMELTHRLVLVENNSEQMYLYVKSDQCGKAT